MSSRLSALLVWGLAAAVAVFWALRLLVAPLPVPTGASLAGNAAPGAGDLRRLLGAAPVGVTAAVAAPPDAATRFRLTGIVATTSGRGHREGSRPGVALISLDGKPPRAYRVGDRFDSQLSLISVALRSARIGAVGAGDGFVLELPPPTPAATGRPGDVAVGQLPGQSPGQSPGQLSGQGGAMAEFGMAAPVVTVPAPGDEAAPSFQVQPLPPGVQLAPVPAGEQIR